MGRARAQRQPWAAPAVTRPSDKGTCKGAVAKFWQGTDHGLGWPCCIPVSSRHLWMIKLMTNLRLFRKIHTFWSLIMLIHNGFLLIQTSGARELNSPFCSKIVTKAFPLLTISEKLIPNNRLNVILSKTLEKQWWQNTGFSHKKCNLCWKIWMCCRWL